MDWRYLRPKQYNKKRLLSVRGITDFLWGFSLARDGRSGVFITWQGNRLAKEIHWL